MMYILKCPCGNTGLKRLDNKNMFKCDLCGKELDLNELAIEEVEVQIEITDY